MSAPRWLCVGVATAVCAIAARASAQSLSARVDGVRQGVVSFRFPSRPDVCGDGDGSWASGRTVRGSRDERGCVVGPVTVSLGRDDGQTVSVRTCVACTS